MPEPKIVPPMKWRVMLLLLGLKERGQTRIFSEAEEKKQH
jgi:hypothetical protein